MRDLCRCRPALPQHVRKAEGTGCAGAVQGALLTAPALADSSAFDNPLDRLVFAAGAAIVVATSGGSDSTALLHLLKDSIERRGLNVRIVAATVDHRLRTDSTIEANAVAAAADALGVEHRILTWSARKPATGLQSAARSARHRLLAELAEQAGASAVLVGHTADDQAETVIMRRQRGDGPGLAGIAPATLYDRRVWFVRPLLNTSRAALRQWLSVRGVGWIDDPSNDNPDFERVAIRKALDASGDRDALHDEARHIAADAAGRRAAVAQDAAALLEHVRLGPDGRFVVDRAAISRSIETEGWLHALRVLLAATGDADHLPDLQRSRDLLARMVQATANRRFSLGRCVIEAQPARFVIRRERRRGSPDHGLPDARPTPWGEFLPAFEMAPAIALARLTGAVVPPSPPWRF